MRLQGLSGQCPSKKNSLSQCLCLMPSGAGPFFLSGLRRVLRRQGGLETKPHEQQWKTLGCLPWRGLGGNQRPGPSDKQVG